MADQMAAMAGLGDDVRPMRDPIDGEPSLANVHQARVLALELLNMMSHSETEVYGELVGRLLSRLGGAGRAMYAHFELLAESEKKGRAHQ